MSGSLTLALRTAQSGLLTNQEALSTVSNNIANVNTPGYSRKVANMEQRVVVGQGAGVQIADVTRKVDEGLIKSLRLEISALNTYDARDPYYQRLQELFGKPEDNTSLSHIMNDFTNSIETLALNPANTMEQSEVMRQGKEVALMLNRMSGTIQELRLQTDADIASTTARVNELLNTVHTLNNKLIANTAIKVDVTDLRDQRDTALDELSSLIDIRYYYRGDGDAVVFTSGGRTLVDNAPAEMSHLQASAVDATATHAEGDLNGIYLGATISTNDITSEIRSGKLKGLIDMRDSVLTNLQSQIDEFAGQLRDAVNSVHNAGAPFPGIQTATGSRSFIDGANQTMTFTGTTDTTLALVDGSGNQTAVTTMRTLLGGASANINTVASSMQTWLRSNGASGATVALNSDGKFTINLNTSTVNMVMRDQSATTNGSSAQNATISFDANAGGTGGLESVSGFSNFLGLNDFYVDNQPDSIHDTNILANTYTLGANTTLTFYNKATGVAGAGLGSVSLTSGQTLDQIVAAVNNADISVTASKVPDGAGFRLRLSEKSGVDMVVSSNTTFTTDVGLKVGNVRTSSQLKVREDIITSPGNISRGALQWDSTKGAAGEYLMSTGDDTTVQAMARKLSQNNSFSQAGGLAALSVSFTSYSISIISNNASLSSTNKTEFEYQTSLTASLQSKSDNFRGVNLDEEMTQLMMFQQAYGAAARIITTVQKMFDALEAVI